MNEHPSSPSPNPEETSPEEQPSKFLARATGARSGALQALLVPTLAILAALIIGAFIIALTDIKALSLLREDTAGALGQMAEGVWVAYRSLFLGAFGSINALSETLFAATPLILAGLAVALGFRAGLFNIGANGQMIIGGMAAIWVGLHIQLPAILHIPLALLAAILGGAIWGGIAGLLKARTGAHEVITTMMLSYVATYLTSYMVNYPFKAPGWVSQTNQIYPSAELPRILQPTQLSASFIIAVIFVVLTQYILQKTTIGYEIRATGLNPLAAENGGINVGRKMIIALLISGALAGFGGAGEIMGVHRRFIDGFSPGYGWDGLAVALVGGLNPIGILLAAILFGALRSGGMVMTRVTGVPLDIVFILQALVILFVAAPTLFSRFLKRSVN